MNASNNDYRVIFQGCGQTPPLVLVLAVPKHLASQTEKGDRSIRSARRDDSMAVET